MLMEQAIEGEQFNLDGYFYQGKAHLLGIVDELMYPGTQAFLRFHYPSKLSTSMQEKALKVAETFLKHIGFNHSFFNLEFFVEKSSGEIKVIEFNPRLGSQLADLYGRVDGVDVYAMQLALAQGQDPAKVPRRQTQETCAASFVFRKFDGAGSPPALTEAAQQAFKAQFADALLFEFRKSEVGLQREYKWLGSHRYGVVHLGARDESHLKQKYLQACQLLGWTPGPQFD
jgi:ATP-grasp domain